MPDPLPQDLPLAFGLNRDQLPAVAVKFRVASTKIMSGFDEIVVQGDGQVLLRTTAMANETPRELRGGVEAAVVETLLHVLQAEGFAGWDELYPAETHEFSAKVFAIRLGDEVLKEVSMCTVEFPEFSRAYGALKLVAALARPEVLTGTFFSKI